jgi:hypothetical protein
MPNPTSISKIFWRYLFLSCLEFIDVDIELNRYYIKDGFVVSGGVD